MIDLEALPGIFGDTRIAWVHLTGFSCVGLSVACPIDLVVCLDHGREQQEIAARIGVTFLSLEGAGGS